MAPRSLTSGFEKDKRKLYDLFVESSDLKFESYTICWKKMKFSLVYSGLTTDSTVKDFVTQVFLSLLDDIKSHDLPIQYKLAAFYTMYSMAYKQPVDTPTCIRMTRHDVKNVKQILDFGEENGLPEVRAIWNKLLKDETIDFVHRIQPLGPFSIKAPRQGPSSQEVGTSDPVDIQKLSQEYLRMKNQIFAELQLSTDNKSLAEEIATHDIEDIGAKRRRLKASGQRGDKDKTIEDIGAKGRRLRRPEEKRDG